MNRQRLLTAAKFLVGVALLGWVLSSVDWSALQDNLVRVDAWVLLAILAVTALEFGTRFAMWHALLRNVGQHSTRTVAEVDLSIKFINHVVPSKAAGHAVAPLVLRHFADLEWSDAVAIAGSNTALYSLCYGLVAIVGLAVFAFELPLWLLVGIAASTGLYLLATVAIWLTGFGVGRRYGQRLLAIGASVPVVGSFVARAGGALPAIAGPARETFQATVTDPRSVIEYALAMAGTVAVFPAIRVGLLLSAFGEPFEPALVLPIALVAAYSLTIMPITPGGVGVAEFSALYVFVALGVPEAAIVSAILIDRFLGVYLPAFVGWLPMMNVDLGRLLQGESAGGDRS
ncbi:hypothetical protein GCM10028857_21620 [Salinarchaeum chitinilyticum]